MGDRQEYKLPEAQNEQIFRRRILPEVLNDTGPISPSSRPTLVMVGGQPGAGKSTTKSAALSELAEHGGALSVEADDLRSYHPDNRRLMAIDDKTAADFTHADASRWADKLEAYAVENRYNVLLEGTLKTPENTAAKLAEYRAQGYATEVRVVAVSEADSWRGVVNRYEAQKHENGTGRMTPRDVHDRAYRGVLDTVDHIETNKLADRVVVADRQGNVLYENRLLESGEWEKPTGMRAALEAERARVRTPAELRERVTNWEQIEARQQQRGATAEEIADSRQHRAIAVRDLEASNARGQVLDGPTGRTPLRPPPLEEGAALPEGTRAGGGITPKVARGMAILGVVTTAYDTGATLSKTSTLNEQGNTVGSRSEWVHFGSRNLGGWGGAVLGASAGAAAGVETGPGLLLTGAVGGIVGAFGGEYIASKLDERSIFHQDDEAGNTWVLDPEKSERGWRRTDTVETVDPTTGRSHRTQREFHAGPSLENQLNFQASSTSVQLTLASPPIPENPYSLPASEGDTPSMAYARWRKSASTGQWERTIISDNSMYGAMNAYTEVASTERAAQLEQQSADTLARNVAQSPFGMAIRYEAAHTSFGWSAYGEVPPAVTHAKNNTDLLLASDGNHYERQADGSWISEGFIYDTQAKGNTLKELEATRADILATRAAYEANPPQPLPAITPEQSLRSMVASQWPEARPEELDAATRVINRQHDAMGIDGGYSLTVKPHPGATRPDLVTLQENDRGIQVEKAVTTAADVERELQAPARENQQGALEVPKIMGTPEQREHAAMFKDQLGTQLAERGFEPQQVDTLGAAAASHLTAQAHLGPPSAFLLSQDSQRVAVRHDHLLSEFEVPAALAQTEDQHWQAAAQLESEQQAQSRVAAEEVLLEHTARA